MGGFERHPVPDDGGLAEGCRKMVKQDNVGDRNKLYVTLHEVSCLQAEYCKRGQKARSLSPDKESIE